MNRDHFEVMANNWEEGNVLLIKRIMGWQDSSYDEPGDVPWRDIGINQYKIREKKPEPFFYKTFELAGRWIVREGEFIFINYEGFNIENYHEEGWKWVRNASDIERKDSWMSLDRNEVKD